jgi:cytochrome oxidase Cu insertion factor (SCO1/SenC/PrrC family)
MEETQNNEPSERELHPILIAFKKRPYLYAFIIGALFLTLLRPCLVVEADAPTKGPKIENFVFIDHEGAEFRPSDLEGQAWIAGFFDPREETEDSKVVDAMLDLETRYVKEDLDIHFVLMSVAPKAANQEVLKEWFSKKGLSPKRWVLLSAPDAESLRKVAVNIFRSQFDAGQDGENSEHSDRLWLIDKQGFMRGHPRQGRDNFKTSVRNHDDIFEWSRVLIKERLPK